MNHSEMSLERPPSMLPSLRADAAAAATGDARAALSVRVAPLVAAWSMAHGPLPTPEAPLTAGDLYLADLAWRFGRIPGSFAWGSAGRLGHMVCRAMAELDGLCELVAPILARGLFGVQREHRRELLEALPAECRASVKRGFERLRGGGAPSADVVVVETAALRSAAQDRAPTRARLVAVLADVTGEEWGDEIATLSHGARLRRTAESGDAAPAVKAFVAWWDETPGGA